MSLFLVPKVDTVKADVVRPLTNKERARLRKQAGGDATPEQLARLADKFGKTFEAKPKRVTRENVTVVEFIRFDDDPDDDPASPVALECAA